MSYDFQQIKKEAIKPVYLFYGEEEFLIDELCQDLINRGLRQEEYDFNLDILYGNETDAAQVANICASYPMMAERRIVVLKNLHLLMRQNIQPLLSYINNPAPSTCLIMIAEKFDGKTKAAKELKNKSIVYQAQRLYDNKIPDWIRSWLKRKKISISNEAVLLLQSQTGNALRPLVSELEKIVLNLGTRSDIQVEDVEKVVGVSKTYNIFELCDSIGNRNLEKSIHILTRMLQMGEAPVGILAMIVRHFFTLAQTFELKSQQKSEKEIATNLKLHPFFVKNYIKQAGHFKRHDYDKAFVHLLEADVALKTSYQKPILTLQMLLYQLAR